MIYKRFITDLSLDGLQVAWPHVLAGIHAEPLHPDVDQVVEIFSHLGPHIVFAAVQVVQAHQIAVTNLEKALQV